MNKWKNKYTQNVEVYLDVSLSLSLSLSLSPSLPPSALVFIASEFQLRDRLAFGVRSGVGLKSPERGTVYPNKSRNGLRLCLRELWVGWEQESPNKSPYCQEIL